MKIAYVMDSTVTLHEKFNHHPDIYRIPITILIENEEFLDGINITNEQLFEHMRKQKTITTSLPSVGKFTECFEELLKEYDYVIALMLSGHLSGTYNSAKLAADMCSDKVKVIDTNLISYPISHILERCMELTKSESLDKVVEIVENMYKQNETYVVVEQLDRLHKSGRLSDLSYYIGSFLNLSPVIMLENGKLNVKEKVRSSKKAKQKIINYLKQALEKNNINEVSVLYTINKEDANIMANELRQEFPNLLITVYPLGTAVGVHTGEHTIGITWYNN